mgnify:CR=1 FL=1
MAFKDLETKRSLRKKYRDSKDQLKYTQKSLASTEQERDIANSHLEKTKAKLDKVTALYVAERAKNAELARKLKAYESYGPRNNTVFEMVWGVEKCQLKKKNTAEALQSLNGQRKYLN